MEKTRGLIIRQSDYGDGNRMLTVFTEDFGIVKAAIYGVKKAKSRQAAASQLFSWAEFVLYFGKGDVASVNSVTSLECFFPIYEDIEHLALCSYFCEAVCVSQAPSVPNVSLLRLLLNSLYACAFLKVPTKKIKAVFELRLAADMGYCPSFSECAACFKRKKLEYFSCMRGGFICGECYSPLSDGIAVTEEEYKTIGYILTASEKKIFSFNASDAVIEKIGRISEKYLSSHMEKELSSLSYLKKILM